MDRYKALALQDTCHAVNQKETKTAAEELMLSSLQELSRKIGASKKFIGPDLKLVVLPEYFLTGFPMQESLPQWRDKACLQDGDNINQALSQLAIDHDIFLSGNAYEIDSHFSDLYFQSSFVINPNGEKVLNYRRLNSMFAPTPHDVWDKYLEIYGYEAVFPVVDTDIGKLACIASEEILYPEIARCLAMRGAEIFLHSSSEVGSPQSTPKNICKQSRAIENMAYLVSANSAGISDIDIPFASTDGNSKIVNYEGLILSEASTGESMVANSTIDLIALRYFRNRVSMGNLLARQRFELYAKSYMEHKFYPPNSISENPNFNKKDFVSVQAKVIQKLYGE